MIPIIVEKPYEFIPPARGQFWPTVAQRFRLIDIWLRRKHGIVDWECRHVGRLKQSLQAGHGILLTPNHCRSCDPIVMGWLARQAQTHVYAMASWHLFNQDWFTGWAIRRVGGFSVYREGIDRKAINTAIDILRTAERPLIVFPEGAVFRTNDRLQALLDGVAFIARSAAKKRAKQSPSGRVVVHPVAMKYLLQGDLESTVAPALADIERRLTWRPLDDLTAIERLTRIGWALLQLKELEYFEEVQEGNMYDRLGRLVDHLLRPLEQEWLRGPGQGAVVPRVKALRMKIMPDMVNGEVTQVERSRRWRQLEDIYLAQQLASYPPDYIESLPSVDRVLETVERFVEDLTDKEPTLGTLKVVIEVGDAIEVDPQRQRNNDGDALMLCIADQIQAMLDRLALESRRVTSGTTSSFAEGPRA